MGERLPWYGVKNGVVLGDRGLSVVGQSRDVPDPKELAFHSEIPQLMLFAFAVKDPHASVVNHVEEVAAGRVLLENRFVSFVKFDFHETRDLKQIFLSQILERRVIVEEVGDSLKETF
ncbi:MAG: hypothetical protein BWY82_01987 [Verrucomicrobia bacterium ADurb.Bin474]|nr:MAG: hypothetical protein BWY82_01987 [Verrucomicrobia bacterium ADurb.Bin474]